MPKKSEPKTLYKCPACGAINDYSKLKKVLQLPLCWFLFRDNIQKCYFAALSNSLSHHHLKDKYGRPNDRTYSRAIELPEKWRGLPLKFFRCKTDLQKEKPPGPAVLPSRV